MGAGPNGVSQEIAMVKSYAGNGVLQQASVVRSPTEAKNNQHRYGVRGIWDSVPGMRAQSRRSANQQSELDKSFYFM